MMPTMIPSFLLKKLYVRGSFKNNQNGYELSLRNTLAPGTLVGLGPMQVDGRDISPDKITIIVGNAPPVRANEISTTAAQVFPLNTLVTLRVEDRALEPGKHRLTLSVNTKEVGELKIDAEDNLA
jgi:hydroxymethylglutaryl-CoA reductase (NADPH)